MTRDSEKRVYNEQTVSTQLVSQSVYVIDYEKKREWTEEKVDPVVPYGPLRWTFNWMPADREEPLCNKCVT